MNLNPEQAAAVEAIVAHCERTTGSPFMVLEGPAGTGKTYTAQAVAQRFKRRTVFTAPTNKAVRVLRETLTRDDFKPECRTIYSLLGLQMAANGEIKELAKPEEDVDLNDYKLVYLDEAGMTGSALFGYIEEAAHRHPNIRWVLMGDSYQLPPVGEKTSPIWGAFDTVRLRTIMRQDNQILTLSTHLRACVEKPFSKLELKADNDGTEGVWMLGAEQMDAKMRDYAQTFLSGESKAIAWRNVETARLNRMIRQQLFAETDKYPWQAGDRITLLEPAKANDDIIGTTDEEGAIERAELAPHPEHGDFECWRIVMRSDFNRSLTLWVLAEKEQMKYNSRVARLASDARATRRWGEFWGFKESFHSVKHAYAITAHRAQGSTYQRAFVSWRDILRNQDRGEALRCLYVAATRPRKELYLG